MSTDDTGLEAETLAVLITHNLTELVTTKTPDNDNHRRIIVHVQ